MYLVPDLLRADTSRAVLEMVCVHSRNKNKHHHNFLTLLAEIIEFCWSSGRNI